MRVAVDEARQDGAAGRVDELGLAIDERQDFGVRPEPDDAPMLRRQRLDDRVGAIQGPHPRVGDHEVGGAAFDWHRLAPAQPLGPCPGG